MFCCETVLLTTTTTNTPHYPPPTSSADPSPLPLALCIPPPLHPPAKHNSKTADVLPAQGGLRVLEHRSRTVEPEWHTVEEPMKVIENRMRCSPP